MLLIKNTEKKKNRQKDSQKNYQNNPLNINPNKPGTSVEHLF